MVGIPSIMDPLLKISTLMVACHKGLDKCHLTTFRTKMKELEKGTMKA
jgi:hypothetical protein